MKWKYFSDEEAKGLKDGLMFKLERAREFYNAPIVITSGFRDPEHNANAGGVSDSAHTKGLAVDIRCPDQEMQKRLCWALGAAGFRRVFCYTRHIHADDDSSKPTPAFSSGGESK